MNRIFFLSLLALSAVLTFSSQAIAIDKQAKKLVLWGSATGAFVLTTKCLMTNKESFNAFLKHNSSLWQDASKPEYTPDYHAIGLGFCVVTTAFCAYKTINSAYKYLFT